MQHTEFLVILNLKGRIIRSSFLLKGSISTYVYFLLCEGKEYVTFDYPLFQSGNQDITKGEQGIDKMQEADKKDEIDKEVNNEVKSDISAEKNKLDDTKTANVKDNIEISDNQKSMENLNNNPIESDDTENMLKKKRRLGQVIGMGIECCFENLFISNIN